MHGYDNADDAWLGAEFQIPRECFCPACRSQGEFEDNHGHNHPDCVYATAETRQLAERCEKCRRNKAQESHPVALPTNIRF